MSAEELEVRVRSLKERQAEAQRKRAQFASQRAVREDRLAQIDKQLLDQFGVSSQEEARAKLTELRAELEETLRQAEQSLGKVTQSAG